MITLRTADITFVHDLDEMMLLNILPKPPLLFIAFRYRNGLLMKLLSAAPQLSPVLLSL